MSRPIFSQLFQFSLFFLFLAACGANQAAAPIIMPSPTSLPTSTETPTGTPTPTPASTPTLPPVCNTKTGSLENDVINTPLLDKPMRYIVYLPACYSFNINKRYPVLFLLHGQDFTEDQWIRIGAASTADQLIGSGDIPPFIMVFPFDYSYKQPADYNFEDVFLQLLLPKIDGSFRTLADSSHRAIGGLSRGGAWALHIGALHPDLFGAIGGHSPAIFATNEESLPRNLLAIPVSRLPRIWLDAGDSDSEYVLVMRFENFLTQNNIPHEWHGYIGWHDEKYWSAHVARYLAWYAEGWR